MTMDNTKILEREPKKRPEPLMDIDELAGYLNVPKSWIYEQSRLKKHNKFPVLKCGKYLRFDRRAVLRWMVDQV